VEERPPGAGGESTHPPEAIDPSLNNPGRGSSSERRRGQSAGGDRAFTELAREGSSSSGRRVGSSSKRRRQ